MDQPTRDINPTNVAHKEIQKYLCIDADRRENPTRWWKSYSTGWIHLFGLFHCVAANKLHWLTVLTTNCYSQQCMYVRNLST